VFRHRLDFTHVVEMNVLQTFARVKVAAHGIANVDLKPGPIVGLREDRRSERPRRLIPVIVRSARTAWAT
jgi:hypothetical protein